MASLASTRALTLTPLSNGKGDADDDDDNYDFDGDDDAAAAAVAAAAAADDDDDEPHGTPFVLLRQWKEYAVTLTKCSSVAAQVVVFLTTHGASSEKYFVNMSFSFHVRCILRAGILWYTLCWGCCCVPQLLVRQMVIPIEWNKLE